MRKKLGVLVYKDVQPIDFIGPWEVFSCWKNGLNAAIDLHLISQEGSEVSCLCTGQFLRDKLRPCITFK